MTVTMIFRLIEFAMTLEDQQANRKLMLEKVRKQRSDMQMMGGPANSPNGLLMPPQPPPSPMPPQVLVRQLTVFDL